MVNNIVNLISKGGPNSTESEKWSDNTINHYGAVVSRILAILLQDKSPQDILQLLRDNNYSIEGDPTVVANNVKSWLGIKE